jgi:hypothetical protein
MLTRSKSQGFGDGKEAGKRSREMNNTKIRKNTENIVQGYALATSGGPSPLGAGPKRERPTMSVNVIGNIPADSHTGGRRRFPARRLHLVDIENLAGSPRPTLGQVCRVRGRYEECLGFGGMDQVEIGSSHLTLVNAALGWPRAHYRTRSGPDGADLALLDVLRYEDVARRFTNVAIGSGDHIFAEAAARLAAQGVKVTVVSLSSNLSARLRLAACEVILLDAPTEAA